MTWRTPGIMDRTPKGQWGPESGRVRKRGESLGHRPTRKSRCWYRVLIEKSQGGGISSLGVKPKKGVSIGKLWKSLSRGKDCKRKTTMNRMGKLRKKRVQLGGKFTARRH